RLSVPDLAEGGKQARRIHRREIVEIVAVDTLDPQAIPFGGACVSHTDGHGRQVSCHGLERSMNGSPEPASTGLALSHWRRSASRRSLQFFRDWRRSASRRSLAIPPGCAKKREARTGGTRPGLTHLSAQASNPKADYLLAGAASPAGAAAGAAASPPAAGAAAGAAASPAGAAAGAAASPAGAAAGGGVAAAGSV